MKCPECHHEWSPYQKHSVTSEAAGESVVQHLTGLRLKVYEYLTQPIVKGTFGGLTDEQLQDGLGMNPSTQRPRRIELVAMGFVRDSGEVRKTRSGSKAVVWVPVPLDLFGKPIASDRPDGRLLKINQEER